jgi:hypothetical protein
MGRGQGALDFAGLDRALEFAIGEIIPGDYQQSRCVLVEPVDNTRAVSARLAGQRGKMVGQGIDQRPRVVAGRRVGHHASRFVDHYEVVVFVNDVERDIFSGDRARFRCQGDFDRDCFPAAQGMFGRDDKGIDLDRPLPDQFLDFGTRERERRVFGQIAIEPARASEQFDCQCDRFGLFSAARHS